MSGLEARLRKLESISDDARIIRPMSDIERSARMLYILAHPDKCSPKATERLTEILYKHLPLKGDKQ